MVRGPVADGAATSRDTGAAVTTQRGTQGGGRRPRPVAVGLPAPSGVTSPNRLDLAARPGVARFLRRPGGRFALSLPGQFLFWLIVVNGLVGASDPQLNLATTLTWNVWYCLVFVLILGTGRGWCAVCPFGALPEWVQRRAPWGRGRRIGLGLAFPQSLSQFGYLLPVAALVVLTWVEERFRIADGGAPALTSYLVLGVMATAVAAFLVFERRTFCRYLCPLSGLIGILGAAAPVAGFRTRDSDACGACTTKECLHGTEQVNGCPWYTWPAAESNLSCGMCGECFNACPSDQVGLYVTRPLESVIRPGRRRADVGWGVAVLAGLVVHEQVHSTTTYLRVQGWANGVTGLHGTPNPVVFLAVIAGVVLLLALPVLVTGWLLGLVPGPAAAPPATGSFVYRGSGFRRLFLPLTYACIPLVGADYLASQLPKFLQGAPAVLPALGRAFGLLRGPSSGLSQVHLLGVNGIVATQVAVLAAGAAGSLFAAWRIAAPGAGASAGALLPVRAAVARRVAAAVPEPEPQRMRPAR